MAICIATAFCFMPDPAFARGLFLETAPWHGVAAADTVLSFAAEMCVTTGDTSAVFFPVAITPIRRGPLRLALTWSYVSVRTAEQRVFGFGDPKLFARLRLAGGGSEVLRVYAEGAARLPTASSKLFPFASGGQELELGGALHAGSGGVLRLGVGRIWSEPGAGGGIERSDVPHSTHAWLGIAPRRGRITTLVSADGLWMRGGHTRGLFQGVIAYTGTNGLRVEARGGAEAGRRDNRVLDALFGLRFVMPLR